jgi:hypothetical protein
VQVRLDLEEVCRGWAKLGLFTDNMTGIVQLRAWAIAKAFRTALGWLVNTNAFDSLFILHLLWSAFDRDTIY